MIRITFISSSHRSAPKEYDTDDAQAALSAEVAKWYADSGTEYPTETALLAVLIERDDHRLDGYAVCRELHEIESMERMRATRDPIPPKPGTPAGRPFTLYVCDAEPNDHGYFQAGDDECLSCGAQLVPVTVVPVGFEAEDG